MFSTDKRLEIQVHFSKDVEGEIERQEEILQEMLQGFSSWESKAK